MYSKSYEDRVSGAVFLIGLGLLFTPIGGIVGGFFPGILFVIGASAFARGLAEGQEWYNVSGGMAMVGIGLFFLLGFNLPLLLILLGLATLFGYTSHSSDKHSHRHDDANPDGKLKNSDFDNFADDTFVDEKPKRDSYV